MVDLLAINQKIKEVKSIRGDDFLETTLEWHPDPFEKFKEWFWEALNVEELDPRIMVLATVGTDNLPSTRAVALQEVQVDKFIFYSAYDGKKGVDIAHQSIVAGNFYWPQLARQINIRARIVKTSRQKSEDYFANRDRTTQLMLHAWQQSVPIASRALLTEKYEQMAKQFADKTIPCPANWGGYIIEPLRYEFYLRRKEFKNNEIVAYTLVDNKWQHDLLTP